MSAGLIDPRVLAKACGAAQRAYGPVADLVRVSEDLPLQLRRQANVVIEELDLLRHFLREATLDRVIARNEDAPIVNVKAAKATAIAMQRKAKTTKKKIRGERRKQNARSKGRAVPKG